MKRASGLGLAVTATFLVVGCALPAKAAQIDAGRGTQPDGPVHTGRYPGKPRPPVAASVQAVAPLQPGVPGSFALRLQTRPGIDVVGLEVEGGEGLSVVSVTQDMPAARLPAGPEAIGEVPQWQISATPTDGGTRFLSGLVTFRVNGVLQAAPFTVPVPVAGTPAAPGAAIRKPSGTLVTTPAGELIDSIKAETSVR